MRRLFSILLLGGAAVSVAWQHPPTLLERALATPGATWLRGTTPHARLYVLRGSGAESHAPALGAAVEDARRDDLRWLGEATFAPTLQLLFVGDRSEMRPFVGGAPGGHAEPGEATAILAAANGRPPLRHELMHVLSWRLWGTPGGQWISEGVATAAAGRCHGYDLDEMAAALARDGRLIPVGEMPRRFTVAGEEGAARYIQAGSVVRHVRATYGLAGLRALWRTGLRGVQASLGTDAETLDRAWRASIARVPVRHSWQEIYAAVRRDGCE